MDLQQLLTHQADDIKELSKHKEYVSLMRFLRSLQYQLQKEALSWSDPNDGYRKRGRYEAITNLIEQLEQINYQIDLGVNNGNATYSRPRSEPESDEYFDSTPNQPAY